jgi:AcrR family transcriptional regulator
VSGPRPSPKREQIIETAQELFSKHGAKRVTIEELCRVAGVSKVTFYRHFANKIALLETIRDRIADETFAAFDAIDAQDIPYPQKIALMTRYKAQQAQRLNVDYIRELVSTDELHLEVKRRFLANLRRAQEAGEIRPDIDLEFHWLVLQKCGELFAEGAWQEVLPDAAAFSLQLRTLFWHGLLTRDDEPGRDPPK